MIQLHERTLHVQAAGVRLEAGIAAAVTEFELTAIEAAKLIGQAQQTYLTMALREERHGTFGKKADEA